MISAFGKTRDGRQLVVLGITRENVSRLTNGRPVYLDAASHPGFPIDLAIAVLYAETEAELAEQLEPLIGDETKMVSVARGDSGKKRKKPS